MADLTVTHYRLPDGSRVQVESDGRQAMITRWVDQSEYGGSCVWGQVFSFPPDTHAAQVDKVLKAMLAAPEAFDRRVLWDENGRAVEWKEASHG